MVKNQVQTTNLKEGSWMLAIVGTFVLVSITAFESARADEATWRFARAKFFSQEGATEQSIKEYQEAIKLAPAAIVYDRMAQEQIKLNQTNEAIDSLKKAIELEPKNGELRENLGSVYLKADQDEKAVEQYAIALKLDPRSEEAVIYQAQALMNLKRVDQADQLLSQFVKANKESALGWYFYAHLKKAKNQLEPAILGYQRTLELKPHFTQASQALAGIYEKQDKPDQALAVYQKAFVELPDVTLAHKITDALLKKDQVVEAIPYLEVIQQLDPQDLNSEVKLGLAYFEAKNYKKSETIIAKLYQKNPDSDRLQYYYGMVNEELQKTEQAIQLFSRIQPKSDFYQDAIIHVAQLYQKLKKNDEAISVMKQALLQNKNPQQAEKLSYILGNLYDQGGKTNEAIAQFTSIVEKNPDHVDALNYLGYTFTLQKKNLEQAGVYLKRAMKLKPNNPYIMDSWGWYLYQTGQLKEAHLQLKKAVQLNPEEPTLKEHLVEVSTKLSPHLLGSPEGSPESGQDRMPASTGSNP